MHKIKYVVDQCAQGFRMTNILKNLGIQEGDDDTVYVSEDDKNDTVNSCVKKIVYASVN